MLLWWIASTITTIVRQWVAKDYVKIYSCAGWKSVSHRSLSSPPPPPPLRFYSVRVYLFPSPPLSDGCSSSFVRSHLNRMDYHIYLTHFITLILGFSFLIFHSMSERTVALLQHILAYDTVKYRCTYTKLTLRLTPHGRLLAHTDQYHVLLPICLLLTLTFSSS